MNDSKFETTTEGHCVAYCDSDELVILNNNVPLVSFKDDEPKGVYGRSVYYPEKKHDNLVCHQYLLVWDEQAWPPHPMDYAPMFVYRTGAKYSTTVYDKGHYVAERCNIESEVACLDIVNKWHSFVVREGEVGDIAPQFVLPLTDELIKEWWKQEIEKAKLKIIDNLRDPIRMLGSHNFDDPPFSFVDRVFKKLTPLVPPWIGLSARETRVLEIIEKGSMELMFESYDDDPSQKEKELILKAVQGPELKGLSGKALRSLNFRQLREITRILEGGIGD